GALVGAVGVAAHASDDLLREEHPDLLVVVELRVPFQRPDCAGARLAVALGVELEIEALAEAPIALGPEVRARLGDREVDLAEDGWWRLSSAGRRATVRCRRGGVFAGRRSGARLPGAAPPRLPAALHRPSRLADRRRGVPHCARLEDVHDRRLRQDRTRPLRSGRRAADDAAARWRAG